MKCELCNNDTWPTDSSSTICTTCKQLHRCDLFSKILTTLLDIYYANRGFDVVKDKCIQFNKIIKNYPLFISTFPTFDPDEHDTDRVALHYLRNYVISEDNNTLQKHHPIKIDTTNNSCIYRTIAILCRSEVEDGAKELRVRNVIDMVLNAEVYHSTDPELHSCLQWGETWKYFVLEQLRDKPLMNGPNAVLTLCLQSLCNIINMRIRSVYPKVPGGSDDLRKRLNRIFSPSDIQSNETTLSTITILWSNMKHISSHSTSLIWMPDCVVPLLPKSDFYINDKIVSPRANSPALQNPAERSFYILSCFCPITQGVLNELVSDSDQQKHSEAEMRKEDTKLSEFICPKCSKSCNDYRFDWRAVTLFRQNFTGARLTYILIDVTSSMTVNLLNSLLNWNNSLLPRITRTKEAVKQLLKEIAAAASPSDQAILTTFDDKLKNPALIPLCKASEIAIEANLKCIDAIELSPRSTQTYFYSVLKGVYEMLERQPFLYVDLYLFSDGIDTSPKKNDKAYQAIIRGLNEKIGAKCHFMNCGSALNGFSVAAWLGDAEADFSMSVCIEEIKTEVKAVYKRDHARTIDLTTRTTRFRGRTLDVPSPTLTHFMTDAEAASIRVPIRKKKNEDETLPMTTVFRRSDPNLKGINDYLSVLPSADRLRSSSATNISSQATSEYRIATRKLQARKWY
ncbi:unnamed protein product [Rotaria magnacalcarata]|uniref:VWFA domain-containing protein n=1 Tax=Rotaria magnacalcarata TaxID=392030 RepID=A0A816V353_9BILA|nr:unnamed protein product [Rotaria magnacalcarata]CAF4044061.1 unnamed protein product [Rotaria magnacalcarata]